MHDISQSVKKTVDMAGDLLNGEILFEEKSITGLVTGLKTAYCMAILSSLSGSDIVGTDSPGNLLTTVANSAVV